MDYVFANGPFPPPFASQQNKLNDGWQFRVRLAQRNGLIAGRLTPVEKPEITRFSHRLDSTNSRIAAITPQCCSRSTDKTAADADAVGLGAGALAGFKAEAQLTSAAIAAGRDMTPQLTAKIKDLADNARDAADDLAKVQLASVISRGTQTAFLSPEDVTIANQLKTVFGDDIPKALNSSQAAALRMNNVLSTISR